MPWRKLLSLGLASALGCTVNLDNPAGRACDDEHPCAGGRVCRFGHCAVPTTSDATVLSGSYQGDGTSGRAIYPLPFRPDVLLIKGDANTPNVVKTSAMIGELAKPLTDPAVAAGERILSLDGDGFTLGANADVNGPRTSYQWIAFRAQAGEMAVGSYAGDGVRDRSIGGLGFQPDYVLVLPEDGSPAIQRFSSYGADRHSAGFVDLTCSNCLQAFEPDGFQVGASPLVNALGVTYHWAAWKAVPGRVQVGQYVGNAFDGRSIAGVSFQPEYVIVKSDGMPAIHKPASTGVGKDVSLRGDASPNEADLIQALEWNGFQIGSRPEVNAPGGTVAYDWVAFGPHSAP
jgi:hypothetical protein